MGFPKCVSGCFVGRGQPFTASSQTAAPESIGDILLPHFLTWPSLSVVTQRRRCAAL